MKSIQSCGKGARGPHQGVRVETQRDVTFGRAYIDPHTHKYLFTPDPDYEVKNHFHVEGRSATYQEQLQNIFRRRGGERPGVLIE